MSSSVNGRPPPKVLLTCAASSTRYGSADVVALARRAAAGTALREATTEQVAEAAAAQGGGLRAHHELREDAPQRRHHAAGPGERRPVGEVEQEPAGSASARADRLGVLDRDQLAGTRAPANASRITTSADPSRRAATPERPSTGRTLIPLRRGSGSSRAPAR